MPHLSTIVAVAVVLGLMILIHEFGHYAAAKFFKVRVEVFSVGFGKRLLGFRRGETDYRISALPLGGYVKMAGENPMDERTDDPGEFLNHPRWQRFIIALAGPAMNIALAIGLLTTVYMVRYERPYAANKPAVIGWVLADSPAAKAGLQIGDRIVRIDGIENPTWSQLEPQIELSPNHPVKLTLLRSGQTIATEVTPEPVGLDQLGDIGVVPDQPSVITYVEPGKPADKAGLRVGDVILAVNGQPIRAIGEMIEILQRTKDAPIEVRVQRGERPLSVTLKPVLMPALVGGSSSYRIGIRSEPSVVERLPFVHALGASLETNKRYSLLILQLLRKMAERKVSMRQVEGPIGISSAVGQAVREEGWTPLLGITAAISLNLGIFNLLPIPILDGGVMLLLIIESLMQKDISLQIKERIYQAAFVFLVLFAVMVIYNDIMKQLPGLAQRLP